MLCAALCLLIFVTASQATEIVGKPAPPLDATDLQQQPVSLAAMRGQTVLVMFWATWCSPCRKEMPIVQTAYEKYRTKGFTVIAINVGDNHRDTDSYAKQLGITFPIVLDPNGKTAERFGVIGLPTNYIIDANGIVHEEIIGSGLTVERLDAVIQNLRH